MPYMTRQKLFDKSPQQITHYFAILLPLITALTWVLAYLQKRIQFTLLGITIEPQLSEINIIALSLLIAAPILIVILTTLVVAHQYDSSRNFKLLFVGAFAVIATLCIEFMISDMPIVPRIVNVASLIILVFVGPLLFVGLLLGRDVLDLYDDNKFVSSIKVIGISSLFLFGLVFQVVAKPVVNFTHEAIEHNIVRYESSDYVLVSREGDKFLLSKLCENNGVKRGAFRFVNVEDVSSTRVEKFSLSRNKCE